MSHNKSFSSRQAGILIALGAMMMMVPAVLKHQERESNREKSEQYSKYAGRQILAERERRNAARAERTANFVDYINADIEQVVQENMTAKEFNEFKRAYAKNPQLLNDYIDQLTADSAQYARMIAENAALIHSVDRKQERQVSFQDAVKFIKEMQAADGNTDTDIVSNKDAQQKVMTQLQMARKLQNNIKK